MVVVGVVVALLLISPGRALPVVHSEKKLSEETHRRLLWRYEVPSYARLAGVAIVEIRRGVTLCGKGRVVGQGPLRKGYLPGILYYSASVSQPPRGAKLGMLEGN